MSCFSLSSKKNEKNPKKNRLEGSGLCDPTRFFLKPAPRQNRTIQRQNRDSPIHLRFAAIRVRFTPIFDSASDSYPLPSFSYRIAMRIPCIVRYLLPCFPIAAAMSRNESASARNSTATQRPQRPQLRNATQWPFPLRGGAATQSSGRN